MPDQVEAELTKYLKANLIIQLESFKDLEKPELLLHRAGFEITDIAAILGKEYQAVQKAISRAGKKGGKK